MRTKSQEALEGYNYIVAQQRSVRCKLSFQLSNLSYEISKVDGALSFSLASPSHFYIQSLSLVLPKLVDEGVFHFLEERTVELVPLSSFEITLLHDSWLSENVKGATNEEVPALWVKEELTLMTCPFLFFSPEYSSFT